MKRYFILLFFTHNVYSMEIVVQDKNELLKRSQDLENSPADNYYDCVTRVMYSSFSVVTKGLSSAAQTTIVNLSEYERFKKLGWPLHDNDAQLGLKETIDIYKTIEDFINKEQYETTMLARFNRRIAYVEEFIHSFLFNPGRPDGIDRAYHALKYHKQALPLLYRTSVLSYYRNRLNKSVSISSKFQEDLELFEKEAKNDK